MNHKRAAGRNYDMGHCGFGKLRREAAARDALRQAVQVHAVLSPPAQQRLPL